jgi:hypothetical protein
VRGEGRGKMKQRDLSKNVGRKCFYFLNWEESERVTRPKRAFSNLKKNSCEFGMLNE